MSQRDTQPEAGVTHALSFDIEDWFHIVEVEGLEAQRWEALSAESSLVERYTDRILEICAEFDARATFFVLGWIAERHPQLIRRIADAGHEVGSHSHMHHKVYEMDPANFREDLRRSVGAIGEAAGVRAAGFRAPSFSITPGSEWAFDALLDEGFAYDASLFPASRGHGGYPCPQAAHEVTAPSGRTLPELPMSVMRLGPRRIAFSGGGYLRLLPGRMIRKGFDACAQRGQPAVVYLHPRDFAVDCPRAPMPPVRRFKCYVGLASTAPKLRMLLQTYRFDTCAAALQQAQMEVAA